MTVAERDELLDAVERLERELETETPFGVRRSAADPLVRALADLVARAVRVWLVAARPSAD